MKTIHILTEQEAADNAQSLNEEYVQKAIAKHPVTFRPYAHMQNKYDKNVVYWVPLAVDIIEAEDKPLDLMKKEGNL